MVALRAALAKSGTVTLELALAGIPMVTAYKVSALEAFIGRGRMLRVDTAILTNLVLGEKVVPEFLQHDCTAENLVAVLRRCSPMVRRETGELEAFSRLDTGQRKSVPAPRRRGPPTPC